MFSFTPFVKYSWRGKQTYYFLPLIPLTLFFPFLIHQMTSKWPQVTYSDLKTESHFWELVLSLKMTSKWPIVTDSFYKSLGHLNSYEGHLMRPNSNLMSSIDSTPKKIFNKTPCISQSSLIRMLCFQVTWHYLKRSDEVIWMTDRLKCT